VTAHTQHARAAVPAGARARTYPAAVGIDDDWNAAAELVRARSEDVRALKKDLNEVLRARNAAVQEARTLIGAGWSAFARAVGYDDAGRYLCSPDLLRKIADQAPTED